MNRFPKAVLTLALGAGLLAVLASASSRVVSMAETSLVEPQFPHAYTANSIGDLFPGAR